MTWTKRAVLLGLTATAGCGAVGPEFKTPDAGLGPRFLTGDGADIGDVSKDPWWNDFHDKLLADYVTKGLSSNLDVRTALARVEQAEAGLRQTGNATQVTGNASGTLNRSGGQGISTTTTDNYALTGAYVFDLFGGIRRGRERSIAELEAAGFSAADARLAYLSGFLGNYIAARFHQAAAELTRRSISLRKRTVGLVQSQVDEGAATQLDLVRAQADYQATQADLPGFIAGFNASVFAIATLLDQPITSVHQSLRRGAPQP